MLPALPMAFITPKKSEPYRPSCGMTNKILYASAPASRKVGGMKSLPPVPNDCVVPASLGTGLGAGGLGGVAMGGTGFFGTEAMCLAGSGWSAWNQFEAIEVARMISARAAPQPR